MNIADLRKDYALQSLDIHEVAQSPFVQFEGWLQQAIKADVLEPTAMHLATTSADNRPSGRIVLLKGTENGQFTFFTNYESRKGHQLAANPYASLTFFWAELERQVRIEGKISKITSELSTAYFQSRPLESQLGAWASPQSQTIADRAFLEQNYAKISQNFADKTVLERPAHWGGYALVPDYFEFWQGRKSRMHDRICYAVQEHSHWEIARLAP